MSLLFAALLVAASARLDSPSLTASRVFFSLPTSVNLSAAVFVDPGPTTAPADSIVLSFFRVGPGPPSPLSWDLSSSTGAALPAACSLGLLRNVPLSTALQYGDATFGALLNLTSTPLEPAASLGTITIGYDYSAATAASPWSDAQSTGLELSIDYQVPTAFKTGVAVYSSWTVGIASAGTFIWYETAIFDLNRPLGGDVIWLDTISNRPIVHSVLSQTVPSDYHRVFPDSAESSSSPWSGWRRLHFAIEAVHIRAAILAVNAKFNLTLDSNASVWKLVHTNVEVEGTAGGTAGHSLRNMVISSV